MPQYFSPTDAKLSFINHPGGFQGEIDAVQFVLTAGESPIHIWNYAYRAPVNAASTLQTGTKGGALFDDTAVSTHLCQLQVILNMDRFKSVEYAFASMTSVGDVEIKYTAAAGWDRFETAGYRLIDGHVSQVGKEIEVRSASYPAITLQFKRCLPLGEPIPLFRAPGELEAPLEGPVGPPGSIYTVEAYNVLFSGDDITRPYEPVLAAESTNPTLLDRFIKAAAPLKLALEDPISDMTAQKYVAPVLELTAEGRRYLFAWHPSAGYSPVADRTDDGVSFIQDGTLSEDLHARVSAILFAGLGT